MRHLAAQLLQLLPRLLRRRLGLRHVGIAGCLYLLRLGLCGGQRGVWDLGGWQTENDYGMWQVIQQVSLQDEYKTLRALLRPPRLNNVSMQSPEQQLPCQDHSVPTQQQSETEKEQTTL